MSKKIVSILAFLLILTGCVNNSSHVFDQQQFDQLVSAVKTEYGDDYYPNYLYEEDYLINVLQIDPTHLNAYYAEGPMMTIGVDTFILLHVKDEYISTVVAAMNEYHRFLKEDSFQYPMNYHKVAASQVISKGNYVALVMLAPYMEVDEDTTEIEILSFYNEHVSRGVNVLMELLP